MTVIAQHHPDQNILTEYSAGSLDYAQAIAVSAHLHYCPRCQAEVKSLEKIGGALLESLASNSETVDDTPDFDQLMTYIDKGGDSLGDNQHTLTHAISTPGVCSTHNTVTPIASISTQHHTRYAHLPNIVRKILGDQPLQWKRVNACLKSARLTTGQNQYGVSLQKIQAGGRVPEHNHRGAEITVVLKGSFSDEDGIYHAGDFLLRQPGDIHRPRASDNEDCLCLSVEQAPVKLTSVIGRIINPFLRIQAI